jgi:hypothetical protein
MKRLLLLLPLAACGHQGKMVVDTPIAPYQKPDISEITGIDEDEAQQPAAKPAPTPAAAPKPAPAPAPAPEKK